MDKIKVLAISGSLRKDSYNRKALQIAKNIALEMGAEVKELDLKELNLPLYDEDLDKDGGIEPVKILKNAIMECNLLLIATPEYNHSISGVLKNAIDWGSRKGNSFSGKYGAIFGVTTGVYGTIRAQLHLRQILTALGVFLLPQPQVFIGNADNIFDESGKLKDQKIFDQLTLLIKKTFEFAGKK
jgi:chromate reductase, NAD(P)H dehydrogenase (quinone)